MSPVSEYPAQDVMQVCRNGHVITDRLHGSPETGRRHCERCGSVTLDRCGTCGVELAGAVSLPGLPAIGALRPPQYCPSCGAAFPWADRRRSAAPGSRANLENLLRRLPLVIRQLRTRPRDRPPMVVRDERDLEDVVHALLPLYFDEIRPCARTPQYAEFTRTDFLLAPQRIAVCVKHVHPPLTESRLAEEVRTDVANWREDGNCRLLTCLIYDPEGMLRDHAALELSWSTVEADWEVRCLIV